MTLLLYTPVISIWKVCHGGNRFSVQDTQAHTQFIALSGAHSWATACTREFYRLWNLHEPQGQVRFWNSTLAPFIGLKT